MLYPMESNYVVSGFCPPEGKGIGRYGFSIGLKAEFAKKCLKFNVSQKELNHFNSIGNSIIKSVFDLNYQVKPYHLREHNDKYTILLAWCSTIGNSCEVGLDGNDDYDRIMKLPDDAMIEYHPHNVDSLLQSYSLLALWLKWYDIAYALVT